MFSCCANNMVLVEIQHLQGTNKITLWETAEGRLNKFFKSFQERSIIHFLIRF